MTAQEKQILAIAVEIDRLLTDGIEIHPNSPIHEKLNQALRQSAVSGQSEQFYCASEKDRRYERCEAQCHLCKMDY